MHDNKRKSLDKNTKCSLKVTALCAKGSDNEKNENNVKYTRLIFIITQI